MARDSGEMGLDPSSQGANLALGGCRTSLLGRAAVNTLTVKWVEPRDSGLLSCCRAPVTYQSSHGFWQGVAHDGFGVG